MATITLQGKRNEVLTYSTGSIASGATDTTTVDVTDVDELSIWWQLLATTTTGDLTALILNYAQDRTTSNPIGITANMLLRGSYTAFSDGANVNVFAQADVRGMDKVAVTTKNNNVASKTASVTLYLSQRS